MTEKQRADHRRRNLKYARSPKGKLIRGRWYERHRGSQLRLMRSWWAARHPKTKPCDAILCGGTALSTQRWCIRCASAFFGPRYALRRRRAA